MRRDANCAQPSGEGSAMSLVDRWLSRPSPDAWATTAAPPSTPPSPPPLSQIVAKGLRHENPQDPADLSPLSQKSQKSQASVLGETCEATARVEQAGSETDRSEPEVIAPVSWYEHLAPPELRATPYDQACPERRGRVERVGAAFLHFCVSCGAWGSFGYGVTRDQPGLWYCGNHRPRGNQVSRQQGGSGI